LVYRETSHTKGVRITGKAMVVSTVNAKAVEQNMKKYGR
jgi:hypothetical protein